MRQRLLFEGELSDVALENVFPTLISKAVETGDDVFLRWNGATIRVEPMDTIDTLMRKYDKEIRLVGLANKMEMPADQSLTEQAAYDDYQERTVKSGDRADQLAWAIVALLAAQLIGGSKFYELYVMAAGALAYLLLHTLQSAWQGLAIWIVKQRISRGQRLTDYPSWVGGTAWVLYALKLCALTAAALYGIVHFIQLL